MSARRSHVLRLAVLGLLNDTPLHGYELRKRLNSELGVFRAFSYGSLYPCLRELLNRGLISNDTLPSTPEEPQGTRSRISYRLTARGREQLYQMLGEVSLATCDDECFGVHFALFEHTRAEVRLRILEGRRSRLLERLEDIRSRGAERRRGDAGDPRDIGGTSAANELDRLNGLGRSEGTDGSVDPACSDYPAELRRHGLEWMEREVRWLTDLIHREQVRARPARPDSRSDTLPEGR